MRFNYVRLKGYVGIYNGLGLNEISLDFTKSKNKIVIISGKNGCGKSTILKSLSVNPESSSDFVPNMGAEKELIIQDEMNIYRILISSPINSNGGRSQTKAYISKNGTELNTNGNITSYKDIVYTEFELDPNYISLSKLSSDDRGIADKSPAERKKFVSSILDSLDTYNNINKNLTKKSNVFKSYINNLDAKIRNIGDEKVLRATQFDIDNRYKNLNNAKIKLEKEKTEAESFINIVDPDKSIQIKYDNIYDSLKATNNELDSIYKNRKLLIDKINIDENDFKLEYDKLTNQVSKITMQNQKDLDRLNYLIIEQEEQISSIEIKKAKVENIKNDYDIQNLKDSVEVLRNRVKYQESVFKRSGVTDFDVSRTEFIFIFSTLNNIKTSIEVFKANRDQSIIQQSSDIIRSGEVESLYQNLETEKEKLDEAKSYLKDCISDIDKYNEKLRTLDVLKERPGKCNIDTCPLIMNALDIKKTDPLSKLKQVESEKIKLEKIIVDTTNNIDNIQELKEVVDNLLQIIDSINTNKSLLIKIPTAVCFTDIEEFLNRIYNGNNFNEIEDSIIYMELADDIEDYKNNKNTLISLEADLKVNENKIALLDDMCDELNTLDNKLNKIIEEINNINKSVQFNNEIIDSNNIIINSLNNIFEVDNRIKELEDKKKEIKSEYQSIKDNMGKIRNYIEKIHDMDNNLYQIDRDLEPLQDQKDQIQFSLTTLESYKQELEMYNDKYNTTNILKKYSSPTAGGIQTLYISLYMSKTLSLANELLSMMFNGEYRLLPYVINSNEFRIPFIGNGLEVDDISSGSTSQVCMMGLVMNMALLHQASTKYNITRLDEADSGLDNHNRFEFVEVIYKLQEILGIEQLIMISHSIELEMSNVDIIKLKGYEDNDSINEGNVIFDYQKITERNVQI